MEYFNFEDAANALPPFDLDEYSSLNGEIAEQDGNDCFDSVFFDKSHGLPVDRSAPSAPIKFKLMNNVEIEVVPQPGDPALDCPMFRAKNPCDLCSRMGLECFLASRGSGTMISGCTCCISLYRECSFTHSKLPKGFVSTFPGISEDQQVCEGTVTERKKSLKSFDEARGRKTGARFPRDAVKILKQWLGEHSDHPYPNEREKDELKQLTGLKRSQISNWLANARRRGKVRPSSDPASPILGAIDIPKGKTCTDVSELNPMERWKASPPENEPASMTAIAKAVTSTPLPGRQSSQSSRPGSKTSSRKASSEDDSGLSMFRAPSASSFETKGSSNSDLTFASSRSRGSKGSFASSQERRRRRRAPMTQRAAAQQAKSRSARIFQCTFCTDTFPAKYDWQRHEKSLHLALERWTCCPEGSIMTDQLNGRQLCVFCQAENPTPEHLESHNFMACQEKTLQERTFYRKDHLRQHLKLMHEVKFGAYMESWKSTTNEIKSSCGFCPSKFTTWQQRADHLAAHFRNGADMSMWANGWGFEPFVERLVENAIPPYLIGHERSTMEPYVARLQRTPSSHGNDSGLTFGSSAESSEPDQITKDSNCWGRLEQELGKFVTQRRILGFTPSDKELQDHARRIIYEDDDPWNWTCADNQQWLDTFKFQQNIGPITDAMQTKQLAEVPVMAPYVIKGGLKNKASASSSSSNTRARLDSGAGLQHTKSSPTTRTRGLVGTAQQPVAISPATGQTPLPDFDPNMDLDFDSIDFSSLNLDLGLDNDMNMNMLDQNPQGLLPLDMDTDMNMNIPLSLADLQPSSYVPAQAIQADNSIDEADIFGAFDMQAAATSMGMNNINGQIPGEDRTAFMSDQEMGQLTGYTAGFGMK